MKPVVIGLVLLIAGLTAQAQQTTLVQMATEAKVDWLLGQWMIKTIRGAEYTYGFSTILEGRAVKFEHSGPQANTSALIAYDPEAGTVKHFGANNKGMHISGVWTAEEGQAILKTRYASPDGKVRMMEHRFSKLDEQTMKVEWITEDERGRLEYKRKD